MRRALYSPALAENVQSGLPDIAVPMPTSQATCALLKWLKEKTVFFAARSCTCRQPKPNFDGLVGVSLKSNSLSSPPAGLADRFAV